MRLKLWCKVWEILPWGVILNKCRIRTEGVVDFMTQGASILCYWLILGRNVSDWITQVTSRSEKLWKFQFRFLSLVLVLLLKKFKLCSNQYNDALLQMNPNYSIRRIFNFLAPVFPKIFYFLVRYFDIPFVEILMSFAHKWHKFLLAENPSSVKRIDGVFCNCCFSNRSLPSFREFFGNLKINVTVVQRVTCSRVKKFSRQYLIF